MPDALSLSPCAGRTECTDLPDMYILRKYILVRPEVAVSIRQSLLAILDQGPCYGYQLLREFDRRTGSTWPLNVGQVYNTVDRLERDALVEKTEAAGEAQQHYRITDAGHAEVAGWLSSPVVRSAATRDELAIKLAIAVTLPGVDVAAIIQAQRTSTLRTLQDLTRTKNSSNDPETAEQLSRLLVVDSLLCQAEAEVRWLEHSEQRIARAVDAGFSERIPLSTESPKRGRPVATRTARANR